MQRTQRREASLGQSSVYGRQGSTTNETRVEAEPICAAREEDDHPGHGHAKAAGRGEPNMADSM